MGEEVFLDWLFMSLIALIFWLGGFIKHPRNFKTVSRYDLMVRAPVCLALLAGRRNGWVEIRGLAWQIDGFVLFGVATILALFENEHYARLKIFGGCVVFLLFLQSIFISLLSFFYRKR